MISDDITRLVKPAPADKRLDIVAQPDAIRAQTGLAQPNSGGIASPLTETDYAARAYYPTSTASTSDGLFVLELRRVASISFRDARSRLIVMEFKDKP